MSTTEHIKYMRENVNPLYKMDQEEALKYAAKMGASDSLRGIAQGFGKIVGWETLTDSLKEKDKKLTAILNHPEYGLKANAAFLGSAIVADPLTYVPIAGWVAKGKKAKNLAELTKYGAVTSAIVGGVGYTSEDRGMLISDDSSFAAKKLEQTAISSIIGGALIGGGSKTYDLISKARGNKGLFNLEDVVVTKSANDLIEETENTIIERGSKVFLKDRNNQGTVISVNEKQGTAKVYIVNAESGKSIQKTFTLDELRPPKKGQVKKTKEIIKDKKQKVLKNTFIINKTNKRKGPVYTLYHEAKDTTYQITKVKDKESGQFTGSWEVTRKIEKQNPMTDPSGEMGSFPKIVTNETMPTFKTLVEAKNFVNKTIDPNYKAPINLPKEKSLKVIEEEASKINTPEEPKLINPIINLFSNISSKSLTDIKFGHVAWNKITNDLKAESSGAIIGGFAGSQYTDEDDNFTTNFGKIMAGVIVGAGSTNRIKFLDNKYYNGHLQERTGRYMVADYGLASEYLLDKRKFRTNKSKIAMDFLDIVNRAEENLGTKETKLLLNFMVGDSSKIDGITKTGLKINQDARLLITKYSQELVDLGVLNPKTMQRNIDTYLKRVYANKKLTPKELQNNIRTHAAIRTIGDNLKPRGPAPKTILKSTYLNPDKNYKSDGWYILSEKGKKVTIKRDYTKQERKDLGEIEDVAYAIAETGRLFSNDIATLKFFKVIKDKYALSKEQFNSLTLLEQNKYLQVPEVQIQNTKANKYGDLAGMYLDKATHNDLINTFRGVKGKTGEGSGTFTSGAMRAYDLALSVWKRTKTAWNFGTHVANTASNVILLDGADTSQKYLIKALKEYGNKDSKIFKQAILDGVLDADMVSNELSRKGSLLERKLAALENKTDPTTGIFNSITKLLKSGKRNTLDKLEELYQAEDHVFRLAVYMDRLDKGFNKADAALEARKWFIDYDINAPIVQNLKRTALPFVSYTYRIAPLLAEIAVKRPIKFAKWAGIAYSLNEIGTHVSQDVEGEKLDRLTMRENENKDMFGMPFMPSAVIRTPFDSSSGDALYLDVTRWMPGGDIFESRESEGLNVGILPAPLQPGGPAVDLAYMIATKRDPFTGQEIESLIDDDTATEEMTKIFKHFFSKQLPNMPGVGALGILPESYATEKFKKSIRLNRPDSILGFNLNYNYKEQQVLSSEYAVPFGPWESFVYGLGVKLRPVNYQVNMKTQENNFNQEVKTIQKRQTTNKRRFETGSKDYKEYEKEAEKLELDLFELMADNERYLNLIRAQELKVSKEDAKNYNKEAQKNIPKNKKIKNKNIKNNLTTINEVVNFLGLPPNTINGKEIPYTVKELNKLINQAKEQKNDYTDEELVILNNIRLKAFKGGEVNVPYTKDNPEERINPRTGKSYSETARKGFEDGGQVSQIQGFLEYIKKEKEKKENIIQMPPEEQGLKSFTPFIDLIAGGVLLKGGSVANQIRKQMIEKRSIPPVLIHGSNIKGLKELQSSSYQAYLQSNKKNKNLTIGNLQAGIFTTDKNSKRVAKIYGSKGAAQSGVLGSLYNIDSSKYKSIKNVFNINNNKVINTSKPPKDFMKNLNNEIKRLSNFEGYSIVGQRAKQKHSRLLDFKTRLTSGHIDDQYFSLITPDVANFLKTNKFNLIKQVHSVDTTTKKPNYVYVLLKDKQAVMKNGETVLVTSEKAGNDLKLNAMKKIFKD